MSEREEILKAITIIQRENKVNVREALVMFVLADRKRIVEPLVKLDYEPVKNLTALGLCEVYAQTIREVLKNAGVEL